MGIQIIQMVKKQQMPGEIPSIPLCRQGNVEGYRLQKNDLFKHGLKKNCWAMTDDMKDVLGRIDSMNFNDPIQ